MEGAARGAELLQGIRGFSQWPATQSARVRYTAGVWARGGAWEVREPDSQTFKAAPRTLTRTFGGTVHPPRPNWTHALAIEGSLRGKFLSQMHFHLQLSVSLGQPYYIPSINHTPLFLLFASIHLQTSCRLAIFWDSAPGLGSLSKLLKTSVPEFSGNPRLLLSSSGRGGRAL